MIYHQLVHEHKHGQDFYLVMGSYRMIQTASKGHPPTPMLADLISQLQIEFEPEEGEYIAINEIPSSFIIDETTFNKLMQCQKSQ